MSNEVDEILDELLFTILKRYRINGDLVKTIASGRELLKSRFKISKRSLK